MYKTEKTVTLLKTIAIIAGLAILLWSLGLPALRFADAANITSVSDTLSDSAPSASANHTITFVTPSDVENTEDIVIDFQSAGFDLAGIGEEDIDLLIDGSNRTNADWSVSTSATAITISIDTGIIASSSTTTILVGTHATNQGSPDSQIENPASEGSYEIGFTVGTDDSGWTRVVILSGVEVTAAVDTIFTFTVDGVPANTIFNGTATTTGATGSTTIPFGTLQAGVATTTAQELTVSTNAANGYTVTVQLDQALQSSTGADIDGFVEGSDTDDPTPWAVPTPTVGQDNSYGHWGFTSDDTDTNGVRTNEFAVGEYAAASTTPRVVLAHDGPTDGTGTGEGTTYVGYKVEINGLQEAGDDYTATLTYVATPTF
jgi:hypothetical protein